MQPSDRVFRQIVEESEEGIWLTKPDGTTLFVNNKMAKLLSYRPEEMIGRNGSEFWAKKEEQRIAKFRQELSKNQRLIEEIELKRKDGSTIWALSKMAPVFNENGQHIANLSMHTDITERKKAEELIKHSNETIHSIINSTDDLVYAVNKNWNFIYANNRLAQLGNLEPSQLIGKNGWEVFPMLIGTALHKTLLEAMEKKEFRKIEFRGIYSNRIYEYSIFPIKDGLSVFARDITDRKVAEEALNKSKQRTTDILTSLDDYVYSLDNNWNFIYISNKCAKDFNYEPEELIGKNFWERFPRFVGTEVEVNYRKTMAQRVVTRFEWTTIYASGYRDFTVYPSAEGITIFGKDITQSKMLQQQLEEYTKNLERLVEERTKQLQDKERLATIGQTAGMVGHDIRNPLQAMLSDVYLLKEDIEATPECKSKRGIGESLDNIESNIGYINKIVADLQDYARPATLECSDVKLYELIVDTFQPISLPENVCPSINIDTSFKFRTDPAILKRIMTNLIINAFQAMPNGGKLDISAYKAGDKVIIYVEDTGVGIPDAVKPKLFTPMMTTKAKGQGLGLAVVKRLVEALEGKITFESQEGKGTKFIVELPT